ncbi:geobacillin-26 family protein [Alicyclobacillus acidoterrestris]|uniref:Geobacillin-26 family protein n=1 Tax=Alicyclobacillus acidoterrestris (strain ATCC 49025 / DSM 3922 / CIP 106132 / NCIMB 13137 / GD3B) TaxID=1356854 RepID=A0A9E6ZPW0_ALIAG|nr:geobacillin-26 family protein [Alicyclobacillus acidoterrestris]UNO51026.1 geobacillin-26 family protein [Alicyclobacillus acidoterrestris]
MRKKNLVMSGLSLVTASMMMTPITAFASTTPTNQVSTTTVAGQTLQVQTVTDNSSQRVVDVTSNGQSTVATFDKVKNVVTITSNGQTTTINLNNSPATGTTGTGIKPLYVSADTSEGWWGDYADESIYSSSSKYWSIGLGGHGTWSGYQSSKNASGLSTYQNAVGNTSNAEQDCYAAAAGAGVSGIIAIVTAPETAGASAVIAGVVAIGFGITCATFAGKAWTDHQEDISAYYNIPGV